MRFKTVAVFDNYEVVEPTEPVKGNSPIQRKRKIYGRQIENIHRRREKVSGKES